MIQQRDPAPTKIGKPALTQLADYVTCAQALRFWPARSSSVPGTRPAEVNAGTHARWVWLWQAVGLTPYQPVGMFWRYAAQEKCENKTVGRGRGCHPRQGLLGNHGG